MDNACLIVTANQKKAKIFSEDLESQVELPAEALKAIENCNQVNIIAAPFLSTIFARERYFSKSIELPVKNGEDKKYMVVVFGSPEGLETELKNSTDPMSLMSHQFMINSKSNEYINEIQNKLVFQVYKIIELFTTTKNIDNYLVNYELLRLQETFYDDGLDLFNMLLKEISFHNSGDTLKILTKDDEEYNYFSESSN